MTLGCFITERCPIAEGFKYSTGGTLSIRLVYQASRYKLSLRDLRRITFLLGYLHSESHKHQSRQAVVGAT